MKSTQLLSKEHQNILRLTEAIIKKCETDRSIKKLDKDFFEKSLDFLKNYADKFHHAKEENILFVEGQKSSSQIHCGPGPINQMLHEHDESRKIIREIEKGLIKGDKNKVLKNAHAYANLLDGHIFKEDTILYPMLEDSISPKIDKELIKRYKDQEKQSKIDEKYYLKLLKELSG